MKAKLRALLYAVPALLIVGVYYFVPKPSTTLADLVDAGVRDDCAIRKVSCTMRVDGGYVEKAFMLANCPNPDGGKPERIIPRAVARLAGDFSVHDFTSQCEDMGAWASPTSNLEDSSFRCACWQPDAGACFLPDAGPLPLGMVARGTFGAGCVPTPCVEVFGFPSMRCTP